jgi:Flp pilus assembly protein TadD
MLIDLHRPGEAVDALRRAVELEPQHTAAHRDLGRSLLESGNATEAAAIFARAIGLAEKTGDLQTGRDIHQFLRRAEKTLPHS